MDQGYDDVVHLYDLTEEEIDVIVEDVQMKKGHARTFKRAIRSLVEL